MGEHYLGQSERFGRDLFINGRGPFSNELKLAESLLQTPVLGKAISAQRGDVGDVLSR